MRNLPITNINSFGILNNGFYNKKINDNFNNNSTGIELIFYQNNKSFNKTQHIFMRKFLLIDYLVDEGIMINWKGNPFNLNYEND